MSSYLSYTRGIRDKPIDTVAAVYFLQLSIADFVFWGLHLLIQTNNNLLSISVAKGVKVFTPDGTVFISGITEWCYILCVSVCLCIYIYTHFNIHLTSNFWKYIYFCTGAKNTNFICKLWLFAPPWVYSDRHTLQSKYSILIYTPPIFVSIYVFMACMHALKCMLPC